MLSEGKTNEAYLKALIYFRFEKFGLANSCLDVALAAGNSAYYLHWLRAKIAAIENQKETALLHYKKAVCLMPYSEPLYIEYAKYLFHQELIENCFQVIDNALIFLPGNVGLLSERGSINGMLGLYQDSIRDFSAAIEIEKHNFTAYYNRALSKRNIGDYLSAIEDFNAALALAPEESDIFLQLAITKIQIQDYAGASRELNWLQIYDADNPWLSYYRALILEEQGDTASALQEIEYNIEEATADLVDLELYYYLFQKEYGLAKTKEQIQSLVLKPAQTRNMLLNS